MRNLATSVLVVLGTTLAALSGGDARADKSTVCTITVNSADEREMFRKSLPEDQFQIVELVERGRPDWLAAACRQQVRCDVLVISGHFDGGTEFYSDRLDAREFLPVDELERVSCSNSCPGMFSQLKEVYLFGCNTLDPQSAKSGAPDEIVRSLVQSGRSRADAERLAQALSERHGESSRDQMRRIFNNVPVIYGFSSLAPLGPTAAGMLGQYFQSAPGIEVGSGRASADLLGRFGATSMIVAGGIGTSGPEAQYRGDVCRFHDDRETPAQKLLFIHTLLDRGMPEVRMFFERIEQFLVSMRNEDRRTPSYATALRIVAADKDARDRYLAFARDADESAVRMRMIDVAQDLGWLSPGEKRAEQRRIMDDLLARKKVAAADVDLVCTLNRDRALDSEPVRLRPPSSAGDAGHAALMACLGSAEDHTRVLRALTSADDREVEIAQVYFRQRPITDVAELRAVATSIGRMSGWGAQVRALDTLARHYLSDRESLDALAHLYPRAGNVSVQRAIAGNFIRADSSAIAKPDLLRVLRKYRIKSTEGDDLIDALIRRLQAP